MLIDLFIYSKSKFKIQYRFNRNIGWNLVFISLGLITQRVCALGIITQCPGFTPQHLVVLITQSIFVLGLITPNFDLITHSLGLITQGLTDVASLGVVSSLL